MRNSYIIETSFYINENRSQKIYEIYNKDNNWVASVYRKVSVKKQDYRKEVVIQYELGINVFADISSQDRRYLYIYFENLVDTLTHDIKSVYTDDVNDRFELPFNKEELHVVAVSEKE